jgi:hypothetical protein
MSSGAGAPTRLLNTKVNPYWGMVKKNTPQAAVYIHGQASPPGFEGGLPTWIPIEFPAVAAFDTQDGVLQLPSGFTLFSVSQFSTQAAGFAVQLYDVDSQMWTSDKLADARILAGQAGLSLIERVPHTFDGREPQVFVRVVNQAAVQADISIALVGVVGGARD